MFWAIAAYAGFGFVSRRVKAAREAHAASSVPQSDEADRVDYFVPRKQP
ncbi:hypothetical protein OG884_31555 [Streptosporangium sp. NBC_01755]|nr:MULTISPECIES: hypothetical protein [unclassified Streptosporangium]WSA29236.1 hypothetical protein OIE13_15945 [Streptosporangium sp. NBC_01810]WSC99320.1 hypothetical protein OG884_31555 [Streptosporangium sp. NBC_01755]